MDLLMCAGCMYSFVEPPGEYKCFCGKTSNPEFNAYVTPHSCGSTCGKTRGNDCTHPCTMYAIVCCYAVTLESLIQSFTKFNSPSFVASDFHEFHEFVQLSIFPACLSVLVIPDSAH